MAVVAPRKTSTPHRAGSLRFFTSVGFALSLALTASPTYAALFAPKTDYPVGFSPRAAAIGDVDGDGRADIVTADFVSDAVSLMRANPDFTFGQRITVPAGNGPRAVALGDLNGDGRLDLVVADYVGTSLSVMLNNGAGSFGPRTNYTAAGAAIALVLADLNGDGVLDLVHAAPTTNKVGVMLGNGDGTFGGRTDIAAGSAPNGVAIGRIDADAYPDLVVACYGVNQVWFMPGLGDGTFGPATNFATGNNPISAAIADLNADGRNDVVVANYSSNSVSVLLGNGDGTFAPRRDFGVGANPTGVVLSDLDADSRIDVVTSNYSSNTLSVRLGDGIGGLGAKTDYPTGNRPSGLALGNLNGDTQSDLAAPNSFANTVSVLFGTFPNLSRVVQVAPGSLDFGTGFVGYPETLAVAVTNLGFGTLQITGLSSDQPDFAVVDPAGFPLGSGERRMVRVRYLRSAAGPAAGVLTVESDDPNSPLVHVPLTGSAEEPPLARVTPNPLRFSVPIGETGSAALTLENMGLGPLTWAVRTEPPLAWLTMVPTAGTVSPGANQSITASANAASLASGEYGTTIQFTSNDPANPLLEVPMRLTVVGNPQIEVSPAALDFGSGFLGVSETLVVAIEDSGPDPLHVSAASTSGDQFALLDAAPFAVAPHAQVQARVRYSRSVLGPATGTLSLESDDADTPVVQVALAGEATPPPLATVTPDSISFMVASGDTEVALLSIGNQGAGVLNYEIRVEPVTAPTGPRARVDRLHTAPFGRSVPGSNATLERRILLFQDRWPWNTPANNQVLDANAIPWDLLGSGNLPSTSFAPYAVVIVAADQFQITYDRLVANQNKFTDYVVGGGVLEFHGAGWGSNGGDPSAFLLPGGVRVHQRFDSSNTVTYSGHPLIAGVSSPFTGSNASNAYFTGLPADAHVIARDGVGNVTLAEYRYGAGFVIVSGQNLEYGYAFGQAAGQMLRNLIPYAYGLPATYWNGVSWLSVSPAAGQVGFGSPARSEIKARSLGLLGGSYSARLRVLTDDPARRQFIVPVRLEVAAQPKIAVSPALIDFGSDVAGVPESSMVQVTNLGAETLTIASMGTDSPEFSVSGATSFALPQLASRSVTVRYERTTVGSFAATLTVTSDDPETPYSHVALSGSAQPAPVMEVAPDSVLLSAAAGTKVTSQLTIHNRGPGPLVWTLSEVPQVAWLIEGVNGGTVAPLDSEVVSVSGDATSLVAGTYSTRIRVSGNDPLRPLSTVEARLDVAGIPHIAVTPSVLDFGAKFLSRAETLWVAVRNTGTDVLHVHMLSVTGAEFSLVDLDSFQLAPTAQRAVRVGYARSVLGIASGVLSVESDDPGAPVVQVGLTGEATVGPVAVVGPESIVFGLRPGETRTTELTVRNVGGSVLTYDVRVEPYGLSPAPVIPDSIPSGGPDSTGTDGLRAAPARRPVRATARQGSAASTTSTRRALLFQDHWPWDVPANNQVLDANGIPWDLVGSGTLPSTDLTSYAVVISASDQYQVTYDAAQANMAAFTSYVAGGGVLEFHGAGWGSHAGDPSGIELPGGVHVQRRSDGANTVADPGHPLMAGVPNPFTGTNASNAYIVGLPSNARVITRDAESNPTLAEYPYGFGFVVVSGQALEYGFANVEATGQILRNLIPYCYMLTTTSWLGVADGSGLVAPDFAAAVQVEARSAGLPTGTYRAQLRVTTNDPRRPSIVVPVQLQVIVPTPVEVSVAAVEATPDGVRLSWYLATTDATELIVYRGKTEGAWAKIGNARRQGDGLVPFEDRAVTPGARYGYRVGLPGEGVDQASGEVWADVPRGVLALRPLTNPLTEAIAFEVSLATREPAHLELFDVAGHRVVRRELVAAEALQQTVRVEGGARPAPGIYWVRLTQAGRVVSRRVAVVR